MIPVAVFVMGVALPNPFCVAAGVLAEAVVVALFVGVRRKLKREHEAEVHAHAAAGGRGA